MKHRSGAVISATVLFMIPSLACTQESVPKVNGHLHGTVTVSAAIDSTGDYSGIEIIVTDGVEDGPDTLGYAVTAVDGSFETNIVASERGVYPLVMKRRGTVLNVSEYVVVDGDSASLRAELPLGNRVPIVRSKENSAWLAFKNAEAQHSSRVLEVLQSGQSSQEALGRMIELEAEVLWSLRSSFPGTMAASVASAKSVVMLDGWNDSLVVARMHELDPRQPGFTESVQAGARSEVRLHGLDAGIALLRSMRTITDEDDWAGIQKEIARAYLDERQGALAHAALDTLIEKYPESEWVEWANRATYEIDNLFPGRPAPPIHLTTREGGRVDLDSLRGSPVVIEFWSPRDRQHASQLVSVASLLANDQTGLQWVSVGLEADDDLYDAFFEGREIPGVQVRDQGPLMEDLIVRYNVETVPTRFLVDADGLIFEKYVGTSLSRLAGDLQRLAHSEE